MADDEDIAALVVDNGSGMCKGKLYENQTRIRLCGHCEDFCRWVDTAALRERLYMVSEKLSLQHVNSSADFAKAETLCLSRR